MLKSELPARSSLSAPARAVMKLTARHALAATVMICGVAVFLAFGVAWTVAVTDGMHITSMIYIVAIALIVILNFHRAAKNLSKFFVEMIVISYLYEGIIHKHFHNPDFPNRSFPGSWIDHISLLAHFFQLPPTPLGSSLAKWFVPIALAVGALGAAWRALRIAREGLGAQELILCDDAPPDLTETVSMQILLQISDTHCVAAKMVPIEFREKHTRWDGRPPDAEDIASRVTIIRDKVHLIKQERSIIVHSGDVTDSGESEEWTNFNRAWGSSAKIFYTPGNHDLSISLTDPWLSNREKKLERFQEQVGNANVIASMIEDARTLANFLLRASLRMSVIRHFQTKGTLIDSFSVGRSSFTATQGVYPAIESIPVEMLNDSMSEQRSQGGYQDTTWHSALTESACDSEDLWAKNVCIDTYHQESSDVQIGVIDVGFEDEGSLPSDIVFHSGAPSWSFSHGAVACVPSCLSQGRDQSVSDELIIVRCNPSVPVIFLNSCRYKSHWILTNAVGWHGATQRNSLRNELKAASGPIVIVTHHKIAEFSKDVLKPQPGKMSRIAHVIMKLERAFGIALDGREVLQIANEYTSRSSGNSVLLLHGHSHQERAGVAPGGERVYVCSCASSTLGNVEDGKLDQTLRILEIRLGSTGRWIVISHQADAKSVTWSATRVL